MTRSMLVAGSEVGGEASRAPKHLMMKTGASLQTCKKVLPVDYITTKKFHALWPRQGEAMGYGGHR